MAISYEEKPGGSWRGVPLQRDLPGVLWRLLPSSRRHLVDPRSPRFALLLTDSHVPTCRLSHADPSISGSVPPRYPGTYQSRGTKRHCGLSRTVFYRHVCTYLGSLRNGEIRPSQGCIVRNTFGSLTEATNWHLLALGMSWDELKHGFYHATETEQTPSTRIYAAIRLRIGTIPPLVQVIGALAVTPESLHTCLSSIILWGSGSAGV